MKYYILLFQILVFGTLYGQSGENLFLTSQWKVDTLTPVGSIRYNDIWGYTDCQAREYAIIGSTQFVHFFDITNPDNIVEVDTIAPGGTSLWRDFKTYQNYAYGVADQMSEGLIVMDMSYLPDSVSFVNRKLEFTRAHNLFIDTLNARLYVAGSDTQNQGLIVYDLAPDPSNPQLLASVTLPVAGYVHDVYVRDNIAYCSHGYDGLYVWDMNDPNQPLILGFVETGGYNHSSWVTEDGNYVIYAEEIPKGRPLGVANLQEISTGSTDIEIVTTFKFPLLAPDHEDNTPHNPFIRGKYLITSYYEDGVQIFDIEDPLSPFPVAHYDTDTTNTAYNGTTNNWGVYPFFPSGTIIASDTKNGLFVLRADSLDFAPIGYTYTPDFPILASDTAYFCENSSLELSTLPPTENNISLVWQNQAGDTLSQSDTLLVASSGLYSLGATNRYCKSTLDSIWVLVDSLPITPLENQGANSFCQGVSTTLIASEDFDALAWYNGDSILLVNENILEVSTSGTYYYLLEKGTCAVISDSISIIVFEAEVPTISLVNDTLYASSASSYQWLLDGEVIVGATEAYITPQGVSGLYSVMIIDNNGCVVTSEEFSYMSTSTHEYLSDFRVYPSITQDVIYIEADSDNFEIFLLNEEGILLGQYQSKNRISLASFPVGRYYVWIRKTGREAVFSVIKF